MEGGKKRSSAVCVHPAVIIIDNISLVTIDDVLMCCSCYQLMHDDIAENAEYQIFDLIRQ